MMEPPLEDVVVADVPEDPEDPEDPGGMEEVEETEPSLKPSLVEVAPTTNPSCGSSPTGVGTAQPRRTNDTSSANRDTG